MRPWYFGKETVGAYIHGTGVHNSTPELTGTVKGQGLESETEKIYPPDTTQDF